MNKYTYYKVIQEYWNGKWEDVDFHETDSSYWITDRNARQLYRENLKAYNDANNAPVRIVTRREVNNDYEAR